MPFSTVKLVQFSNVSLFKASNTPGKKWNTFGGKGRVDVMMITDSDPEGPRHEGWSQLTFHNPRTCALGINILVVPNLVLLLSQNEPLRVTFKALSRTIGSTGMKSMFAMRLTSKEDAEKLCYLCELLQLGATEAQEGRPATLKETIEDPTAAQVIFASENEALLHRVKSKLLQLAEARAKQGHRIALRYVGDVLAVDSKAVLPDNQYIDKVIVNENALRAVAEEKEADEVVAIESRTIDQLQAINIGPPQNGYQTDEAADEEDTSVSDPDSPEPPRYESQDWRAAFR
jgi:hypothetical protein